MPTLIAGFKRQSDDLNGAFLGLSFPIPAFDRNAGAIEGASAGSRWAAERLTLTRSKVRAEVEIALSRYRAFRAIAASGTLGAGESPMELLDIALLAYAEGEAGLLDLLDAAEAVREAVVADVRLRADVWIAYYDLERALGGIAPEVPQPNEEQDR